MPNVIQDNFNLVIAAAGAHTWYCKGNLANLLLFAVKLKDLGHAVRCHKPVRATKRLVRLLVPLVRDPLEVAQKTIEAALPPFHEMEAEARRNGSSLNAEYIEWWAIRRLVRRAHLDSQDARSVNLLTLKLLDAYEITNKVAEAASQLAVESGPATATVEDDLVAFLELRTPDQVSAWYLWAKTGFFRQDGLTLEKIKAENLEPDELESRVQQVLLAANLANQR